MHRIRNPAYSLDCTEGSNPSFSARYKPKQFRCLGFFYGCWQCRQMGPQEKRQPHPSSNIDQASMEIAAAGGQSAQQGCQVFQMTGDQVAHLAFALPHTAHGQQA
jgi:hypothetical protein